MSLFKKIFGSPVKSKLIEPIFPGENFSILRLNMSDGLAFATVNMAYENYPNKAFYPFLVGIELEVLEKNENGHPNDADASKLNQIQDEIEEFLKQRQTVHPVARVTRNGTRDILIYIDSPKLTKEEIRLFCDRIQKDRPINLSIEKDPTWSSVSGFLK
jgi:hypothetical protein